MADPGKNLNTGDNGFPLNGRKQTYDVGVPDAKAQINGQPGYGSYTKGVDVSDGYQDSSGKPKDLSTPTKTTLAQYLSKLTMGQEGADPTNAPPVGNKYPVGDGTATLNTVSTTDSKGFPAPLELPPQNPATFAGGAEKQVDYPTQQFTSIQQLVKKGLSSANATDGNDLLPGVTGTSTYVATDPTSLVGDAPQLKQTSIPGRTDTSAKIINPYTSAVLSNNRFTSAHAAFAQVADVTDPGNGYDPALSVQSKLGEWDPSAKSYTTGRLATIGPLLGLRATTTLGATSAGADPNSGGMEAAALLPGLAQLGTATIDQHVLQAKDILNSLTNDEVPSSNVISPGSQSWGQLNDTNDPYDGTNALGMVTLTLALVAGVQVVIGALGILMGLVTPQTKVAQRDSVGRYAVGQYFPASKPPNAVSGGGPLGAISALASLNFGALLGINPTVFPLSQAMNSGLAAFYGLPQPSGGISLSLSLSTATDSPGFLVNVSRSIIRGFVVISKSLSKIGGNPMNVINSVLSMIDTIRGSKVVAAINVWATLGDQILTLPSSDTDSTAVGGTKISTMDQLDDNLTHAAGKSRLQNSLKLAWASNRAPAQVLLPSTIIAASAGITGLGQFDPIIGIKHDPLSNVTAKVVDSSQGLARIDSATAQAFEATLDSEYVPFYFHDLRTNEMVAFHAFLASLTDDFSAAYEKTEGYGRVEPVRVYKSTERRIGLSFFIAATSEPDFDDMWVKINKLITLVYPQYTQGVQLSSPDGNYVFTQPFSQLIGASPLIRIRLGNLLHGNYSQFALARLFGMGNNNFKVNSYQSTATIDQGIIDKLPTLIATALANPDGTNDYYIAPGTYALASNNGGISLGAGALGGALGGSSNAPQFAPTFEPQKAHIPHLFTVTAMKSTAAAQGINPPGYPAPLVCQVKVNDDPQFQLAYAKAIQAAQGEYANTDKLIRNVIGGQYIIPPNALTPTSKTRQNIIAKQAPGSQTGADDLTNFLSPASNAIAKSFADTGGKGLAGFIETMSFDWYDKVTWELHTGRVAPKLCKVTLNFSPVHDISPGLDHFGYNRAPVYPVGPMAPGFIPPTNQ